MPKIEAAERVRTREVTEWLFRAADARVVGPQGDGGFVTRRLTAHGEQLTLNEQEIR